MTSQKKIVDVAVGVLKVNGQYLVSQRQAHQDLAHFWEFPGGKLESGETPQAALSREFIEEVGLTVTDWQPLIEIPWDYEHKSVCLKVFIADTFSGDCQAKEGQLIKWVSADELQKLSFPAANQGLLTALNLPSVYMIAGAYKTSKEALQKLQVALQEGVKLVQLRANNLEESEFLNLAKQAVALCHQFDARCFLSGKPEWLLAVPEADGLQLASSHLMQWVERPISVDKYLAVSCHNELELAKALSLKADLVLISPVKATSSHPELPGLGWEKFAEMVAKMPVPVYALGGMKPSDATQALVSGAQGIATTSGLWPIDF